MLSWYLHQPESYQLSLKNVGEWVTSRPQVYLGPIRIVKMFSTAKKTQYGQHSQYSQNASLCIDSVWDLHNYKKGFKWPLQISILCDSLPLFYVCHFFQLPVSAVFIQPCRTLSSPFLPSSLEVSPSLSFSDPCLILFSLYVTPVSSEQVRFRKENPGNSAKTMVLVQPLPSPLSICPLASPISFWLLSFFAFWPFKKKTPVITIFDNKLSTFLFRRLIWGDLV